MFKRLLKNKKAQQTAEYALLISLVIAAVVAMQTYAQRTLQARIKGAGNYMATKTSDLTETEQYEPYYLEQRYDVTKDDTTTDKQSADSISRDMQSNTVRDSGGFKAMSFNSAAWE